MTDKANEMFTLPEGRVINQSLFVKDAYNDRSTPAYKVELAFPKDMEEIQDLEDELLELADAQWGEGAGDDEDLVIPILDGDKLAKKREKREKDGSAYKGMYVIRANTIYNADGDDGPGGIQVLDQDAERIDPARKSEVYNGCYGIAAVTVHFYQNSDGDNGIKFYLGAFQKTKDGEKLRSSSDRSNLFKPVGREGGAKREGGRRRRRSAD